MSNRSDDSSHLRIAEIMPLGAIPALSGGIAIFLLSQYWPLACLFGIAGIVSFVIELRFERDASKIEKNLALLGLILSCVSLLLALIKGIRYNVFTN